MDRLSLSIRTMLAMQASQHALTSAETVLPIPQHSQVCCTGAGLPGSGGCCGVGAARPAACCWQTWRTSGSRRRTQCTRGGSRTQVTGSKMILKAEVCMKTLAAGQARPTTRRFRRLALRWGLLRHVHTRNLCTVLNQNVSVQFQGLCYITNQTSCRPAAGGIPAAGAGDGV